MDSFEQEVEAGGRFTFGKNWASFLSTLTEERVQQAEISLKEMLETETLAEKRFLDIGSGSGLFSLAARRLGAEVHSFDYDPQSVACTLELKARFFPNDNQWHIERGSVLDVSYLQTLGKFDIVYAWGVLHHTGNMWQALDNVCIPCREEARLFIAIYNDEGKASKSWHRVKKTYCSGLLGKSVVCTFFIPYFFLRSVVKSIVTRSDTIAAYKKSRGMSLVHDWYDWLGGFPFEVAKPEEIFNFYKKRGFSLLRLKTTNSSGNNQFVFLKG